MEGGYAEALSDRAARKRDSGYAGAARQPGCGPARGFRSQRRGAAGYRSRSARFTSRGFQSKTEDKLGKELTNGKCSEESNFIRCVETSRDDARRVSHHFAVHHCASGGPLRPISDEPVWRS